MNIIHIAPSTHYNEGWGYQENLLPKYHASMGHNVTLIVSTMKLKKEGGVYHAKPTDYMSQNGFRVIRLRKKKYFTSKITELLSHINIYNLLCELRPDFIFVHGLSNITINQVIKYKRLINKNVVIVRDTHADYNIGPKFKTITQKIVRMFWRTQNKIVDKHIKKIYGVTPWRKTFAEDYYRIPPHKTDVLIMGADDEKIDFTNRHKIRTEIRNRFNIDKSDFVIITGGKIDEKKRILELMEACKKNSTLKLIVFGDVSEEIRPKFKKMCEENSNIIYIGWINSQDVYQYYFASELAFFPGQHSVLWEQACAAKIPCVFAKWDGMDHVDVGGNSDFLKEVSVEAIRKKIEKLQWSEEYKKMKSVAESSLTDVFLYSEIAEKSLECAEKITKG